MSPQSIHNNEDQYNNAKSIDDQLLKVNPRSACPQIHGPAGTALGARSDVATVRRGGGGGGGGDQGGGSSGEEPVRHVDFGVPFGDSLTEARFVKPCLPCVGQSTKAGVGAGGGLGDEEDVNRLWGSAHRCQPDPSTA